MNVLMPADVAAEWLRTNAWKRFNSARELVADIADYMASKGLSRSTISRVDVAEYVLRLQAQHERLASSEEAAFETAVREGTTAQPEAEYAAVINAMPLEQWERHRAQLGLTR